MASKPKVSDKDIKEVFRLLSGQFPSAKTELVYDEPFQLLVAVALSAQCTDARVNQTTPALFKKYPTAETLSKAEISDVERLIHSCGFFRAKAKAITSAARDIVDKFGGKASRGQLDELSHSLRGVGRKTASVILNQAFEVPAIAVDTHVKRVAHRLGWTRHTDPVKVEFDLRDLLPMPLWSEVNGLLILHGRRTCKARKPDCENCVIRKHCAFYRSL